MGAFVIPAPKAPTNPRAAPTVSALVLASSFFASSAPRSRSPLRRLASTLPLPAPPIGLPPVAGRRRARSSQVRPGSLACTSSYYFPFPGLGGSRPHDCAVRGGMLRASVCCGCSGSDSHGEGANSLGALRWWERVKEIAASSLVEVGGRISGKSYVGFHWS